MRTCAYILASVTLVLTLTTGCEDQQRKHELVPQTINTPLTLDPTEQFVLSNWWSNGTQLLQLNDDASYVLWGTQNRYGAMTERGRWSQDGYNKLWLEPYNSRDAERNRVGIAKINGALALEISGLQPMHAIAKPPAVVEDRLVGSWTGTIGTLQLDGNSRYSLTPAPGHAAQPVVKAGQNGTWRVDGTQLILQSDSPGSEPVRYAFTADDKQVAINTPGGVLSKK